MSDTQKEWLVRTKSREILGPFSQRELLEELQKKKFSTEDEIASSAGQWISAQTLLFRDVEEVTRTQTRNQSYSDSITFDGQKPPRSDELTPTPNYAAATTHYKRPEIPKSKGSRVPIILVLIAVSLFASILFLNPEKTEEKSSTPASIEVHQGGSPFVREVYQLIHGGDTQNALKRLTSYHEKKPGKDDLEYLIPYSALLITEGESPTRAKKFLEQVLTSPAASPSLKSKAHHWLGYLALSEDEGDMGENHFLESLQLNPKDPAARFNLGRAYLKQRKYSQALDYLQLAELEVPDLWLVHLFKGRAKNALGNVEDARNSFKTAIQTSPERWITYFYYATFLKLNNEWDQARITLKKMLTQDPRYEQQSPPPFGYFQEKIDYEQYLKIFSEIMDKYPGEERELGKLYLTYLLSHSNGNAALVGKQIEALADKDSLFAKVITLQVLIDRDARQEEIRTLLAKMPLNLNEFGYYAYVLRADAKLRLAQVADAQKDFERALLLEPKSAVAHWAYAALLKRLNRKNEAHGELKNLLTFHPTYIPGVLSNRDF